MANPIRLPDDPDETPPRRGSPVVLLVSYALVTAVGGTFGFFTALCGIGGGARRGNALMASDATHGAIILLCTLAGAALGFYAVYRTLGFKGISQDGDGP